MGFGGAHATRWHFPVISSQVWRHFLKRQTDSWNWKAEAELRRAKSHVNCVVEHPTFALLEKEHSASCPQQISSASSKSSQGFSDSSVAPQGWILVAAKDRNMKLSMIAHQATSLRQPSSVITVLSAFDFSSSLTT